MHQKYAPKRKKCPRCVISSSQHKKEYHPAMQLLYIRIKVGKGSPWVAVGWFCRNCGKMMRLREKNSLDAKK